MPEFPPRSFSISVVYPSRRNLPLRTRAVIEFLTEVGAAPISDDTGYYGRIGAHDLGQKLDHSAGTQRQMRRDG